MKTSPQLEKHYTACYNCGCRVDLASDGVLSEHCPTDDCEQSVAHLVDWVTGDTLTRSEIPSECLGSQLSTTRCLSDR